MRLDLSSAAGRGCRSQPLFFFKPVYDGKRDHLVLVGIYWAERLILGSLSELCEGAHRRRGVQVCRAEGNHCRLEQGLRMQHVLLVGCGRRRDPPGDALTPVRSWFGFMDKREGSCVQQAFKSHLLDLERFHRYQTSRVIFLQL